MTSTKLVALALLGGASVITAPAQAGAIAIANNSFELPLISGTAPYYTTTNGVSGGITAATIPGWTVSTTFGNIGVYAPPPSSYTPPDGNQVGYIGGGAPLVIDPGSFSQVLGPTAIAGDAYHLGVYVGARGEGYTLGDYTIELLAGATVLASVTDPVAPSAGTFDLTGLSYLAKPGDGALGALTIVLSGGTSAHGTAYGQVAFDDVTLSYNAVPEPSTWVMMALGFGGIGFVGYRRRSLTRSLSESYGAALTRKAA